jgi:hypothetical protein
MRLARPTRGVRYFGVLCTVVAVVSFPCCSQAMAGLPACEAKPPTIESTALKELTVAGVSLEAQINPQGNETSYKFAIVWRAAEPTERGEPFPGGPLVQEGHIGASSGPVTVSASLSGLQPDYLYWYEVIASNLGGTTRSTKGFLYFHSSSAPNGSIAGPPYVGPEVERTGCLNEYGDLAAAETVRDQREIEAKEAAAKQAVAKEAAAKEAAAKEAEEAALKRRVEEHPATALPAGCIVPSVKGDRLSAARHTITRAHCRLGGLRRPSHYDGALIVTGQAPHRGSTLRNGASVTLVLGPARKRSPYSHGRRQPDNRQLSG